MCGRQKQPERVTAESADPVPAAGVGGGGTAEERAEQRGCTDAQVHMGAGQRSGHIHFNAGDGAVKEGGGV